jgi:hypothetical protein
MQQMTAGVIALGLLVLSGFLYYLEPKRTLVSLKDAGPLTMAEPIPSLLRGDSPNLAIRGSADARAQWHPRGVTVLPNAALAPDGTKTAIRLIETSENGFHRVESGISGLSPGEVYVLSVFVKPADRTALYIEAGDSEPGKYGVARYDLAHGELVAVSGGLYNLIQGAVVAQSGDVADSGLQYLSNGWFRCWLVMPYDSDTMTFDFTLMKDRGEGRYPGTSGSGLLIWGVQLERGSRLTGYSDTAGAN